LGYAIRVATELTRLGNSFIGDLRNLRIIGMVDKTFSARYHNLAPIGSGGMGEVFRAQDSILLITVAIKVLRENKSPEASIRFQAEARATARLNHPNIVRILDFGVTDDLKPYMVMEFQPGENLAEFLTQRDSMSTAQFLQIVFQICAALSHAHKREILHRDLKPSNVIVLVEGDKVTVKLVDFGIAKLFEDKQNLTSTGAILGSPLYMSPEQAGEGEVDRRSDIYSMGCLMYDCLAGHPPFHGATALETISLHKIEEPEAIPDDRAPVWLSKIVMKCLAKNKEDRYQTFDELLTALARGYSESSIKSAAVDKVVAASRPHSKMPLWLMILLSVSLAAAVWIAIRQSDTPELNKVKKLRKDEYRLSTKEDKMLNWITEKGVIVEKGIRLKVSSYRDDELAQCATIHPETYDIDLNNCLELNGSGLHHLIKRKPRILRMQSQIQDKYFNYIGQMEDLETLKLQGLRNFTGSGFGELKNLKKLNFIVLQTCQLNDNILKRMCELPYIDQVMLKGSRGITARGLSYLKPHNFMLIDLRDTDLDDKTLEGLRGQSVLELSLMDNERLTDASAATLKTLKNVQSLTLANTRISIPARISVSAALGMQYNTTDEIAMKQR